MRLGEVLAEVVRDPTVWERGAGGAALQNSRHRRSAIGKSTTQLDDDEQAAIGTLTEETLLRRQTRELAGCPTSAYPISGNIDGSPIRSSS